MVMSEDCSGRRVQKLSTYDDGNPPFSDEHLKIYADEARKHGWKRPNNATVWRPRELEFHIEDQVIKPLPRCKCKLRSSKL
jgi:hypothetical protein